MNARDLISELKELPEHIKDLEVYLDTGDTKRTARCVVLLPIGESREVVITA
jgi:hypothetical protein